MLPSDALFAEEEQRLQANSRLPSDALFESEQQGRDARLRASLYQAVGQDPDTVARQNALATKAGVPRMVVENAEERVASMVRASELQRLAAFSPVLERQLRNPQFAAL